MLVVDEANPIHSEVVLGRDELVYVHPNKVQAEEYSHLPLEQCKHVYDYLINQYKSLAKKIDERINWSELDNTANQLSDERHKLNYRLKELEERQRKKEQEEQARQRKKEQEEQARQRKKEQEEQAPKARGKNKTFDNRMEDLKRYKEMHGHANVSIPEDKSLAEFCSSVRYAQKNPGKGVN